MQKTNNVSRELIALVLASIVMALKIWIGIHLFQIWRAREAAAGRFISRDSETE
jgi:hypothetical protein